MSLLGDLRALAAELRQQEGAGQSPAERGGTAAWHALGGACAATIVPIAWWQAAPVIALLYCVAWELPRNRTFRDSAIDTIAVAVGATYAGPAAWPWPVMAAAIADGAWGVRLRGGAPKQTVKPASKET